MTGWPGHGLNSRSDAPRRADGVYQSATGEPIEPVAPLTGTGL